MITARTAAEVFGVLTRELDAETTRRHGRDYRRAIEQARTDASARCDRVLAHDDLAKRLTLALGLRDLRQWNGYVPPKTLPAREDDTAEMNLSPTRAELVAIAAEAKRRQGGG